MNLLFIFFSSAILICVSFTYLPDSAIFFSAIFSKCHFFQHHFYRAAFHETFECIDKGKLHNRQCVAVVWHEGVADKKAEEIASAF